MIDVKIRVHEMPLEFNSFLNCDDSHLLDCLL